MAAPLFIVLAIASLVVMPVARSHAAAPQVVSTQPRNGDREVAPDLKEIVISFDQDMDTRGFSFMGGGPTFPKVTGKPSWRTARDCVLPVQLEPGQSCRVGINSATRGNFKNPAGEAAVPIVLEFTVRTADGTPVPAPATSPKELNQQSMRQLRDAIEHRYSYRDVHTVDWPATWQKFEPRLLEATRPREFAITAGVMLATTKDVHIWLLEGGEIIPAFRRGVLPNANVKLLPSLISGWSMKHPMVAAGKAAPQTGYIAIHSWERKHAPKLLDAALAALAECKDMPSLIVDVRYNSGGDESIARKFAGCFMRERKLYARHVTLEPSSATGFSAPMDRWIEPAAGQPAYAGKVAVLMGPVNISSAEAFLLMMKQAPGCRLVGARSYGASGNPQPHVLANGVTVMLPSWKALLPDGTPFEMVGITPDVEVITKAEEFTDGDPVLQKALELLK